MNTYEKIISNTKLDICVDKSLSEIRLMYTETPTNKLLCTGGLLAATLLAYKTLNVIEDLVIDSRNRKTSKESEGSKEPKEPKEPKTTTKASRIIHNL